MVHRLQNLRGMKAARGKPARYRGAEPFIPKTSSLRRLETAVDTCRGCDLYRNATQGVFGEGPRAAPLMLVGEQPGDREDLEGRPFVGPAGALLDRALVDARIPREIPLYERGHHTPPARTGDVQAHRSPDGERVASAGADKTVWIWPAIATATPDMLCDKLTANMSHTQWREWVSPDPGIGYRELCPGLPTPPD